MLRGIRRGFHRWRARVLWNESGQAATEYLLVISVMVIAMIAATSPFVDPRGPFQSTMKTLSRQIGTIIADDNSPLLPGGL